MSDFNLGLSEQSCSAVVEVLKAQAGVDKKWRTAADLLIADGLTVDTMDNDKEWRKAFKADVVLLSFTKLEQAIVNKPTTTLSDEQKVTKRYVQMQLGARYNKVRSYLARAEREASMSDDEREAQHRDTMRVRLQKDLEKWIDKIQKAEAVDFPASAVVKDLQSALSWVKQGLTD